MVAIWRTFMKGCKFLVVRRDGTVPRWPHFVLGARDPAAPAALRAYAFKAVDLKMDDDYVESIFALANEFEAYRAKHGDGDPDAPPHRTDDPSIVAIMEDAEKFGGMTVSVRRVLT